MKKEKIQVSYIITFLVLITYTIILIFFFSWGFFTSLKTKNYFNNIDKVFPTAPWEWEWSNYAKALDGFNYSAYGIPTTLGEQILWSFLYAGGASLMSLICTCTVSYVVAKYKYRFCELIYAFVVISMALPLVGNVPAMIIFLNKLELFDTIPGMLIMSYTFLDMYFLIFHGAFSGISEEYRDAARIDGASEWTIFFKIMLPLVSPIMYTVFLINFIERWNNFQFAHLYMPTHPTLAYSVSYAMKRNPKLDTVPLKLASSMILALPMIVLFIVFRNKIMGNMTLGGVKE